MKNMIVSVSIGALSLAGIATVWLWAPKESEAAEAPLPGQQCSSVGAARVCTFKFNDGVRCMYAGETGGKDESPAVAISCTLGQTAAVVPSAPGNPTVG